MSPFQRIGIGHIVNVLDLVGSALIEIRMLNMVRAHNLTGQVSLVVPMSTLWLVVPLAIVGIGKGFHFSRSDALYYQEFLLSLRNTSTAMAFYYLQQGHTQPRQLWI